MVRSLDSVFRKLFKGGGILFFGFIIELAISFLAKIIIARTLGPVNYGSIYLAMTILTLSSTLCLLGLQNGVARYLPRFDDEGDRRGVLVSAFQIALPIAIITSVFVFAFAPLIASVAFHNPSLTIFIRIFGVMIPFATVTQLSIGGIQGSNLATPRVLVENITPPVTRFIAVAAAIIIGAGAIGIAVSYAVTYLLAAVVGMYYLIQSTSFLARVKPARMHRELLSFSTPLVVSGAISFVLSDLDTLMLGYFADTSQIGIYNVIYPLAQLLMVFLSSFGFLFMPIISELEAEGAISEIHHIYQVVTKWIFMTTLPVFLVVALFPEVTIRMTFGAEYVSGGLTLTLLSIAFFSHAIAGPNSSVLTAIGETRLIMWDNLAIGVLNAFLNLLLIPPYGFLGAGAATALSYIVLNVMFSAQLYRKTGIHPFSSALIRPGIVASVLVAITSWVTKTYFSINSVVLTVMFAMFIIVYSIVILRFGGVEEEEIMLVLSFEDRFSVDLTLVKKLTKRFMG